MSAVLVPMIRTFDAEGFDTAPFDASTLVDLKGDQRISVCLPARERGRRPWARSSSPFAAS